MWEKLIKKVEKYEKSGFVGDHVVEDSLADVREQTVVVFDVGTRDVGRVHSPVLGEAGAGREEDWHRLYGSVGSRAACVPVVREVGAGRGYLCFRHLKAS